MGDKSVGSWQDVNDLWLLEMLQATKPKDAAALLEEVSDSFPGSLRKLLNTATFAKQYACLPKHHDAQAQKKQ